MNKAQLKKMWKACNRLTRESMKDYQIGYRPEAIFDAITREAYRLGFEAAAERKVSK